MDNEHLDEIRNLQSHVLRLKQEIENISEKTRKLQVKKIEELLVLEETTLKNRFRVVILILTSCIIITSLVIILNYFFFLEAIWICILSGILGSSVSALISALQRKANGWEFKNGLKYPNDSPKDKFSIRMSSFFMTRPILGILSGFIIYYGFQVIGVFQIHSEGLKEASLIFWSILAGLFAKSMIEKLKDVFKNLVGA
ncbi:hypothetical protein [uncultured Aquimarina sp.]|uniref:hypothetical protein n=1 Tax=uncultured Aquimarina sp. TaxID=575652 RepID=UPI0026352C2E|nr:hypothetical protein [uncultured Aquimarina sp.]